MSLDSSIEHVSTIADRLATTRYMPATERGHEDDAPES